MKLSIDRFLPTKSADRVAIQARVPRELAEKVKKILNKSHLSFSELMTACLERFLEEKKQ